MKLSRHVVATVVVSAPFWVAVPLLVWFISLGWPYDEVAAAWVQSIGSLLGIGVAVCVPAWQKAHEQKQREEQDFRLRVDNYNSASTLMGHQYGLFTRLVRDFEKIQLGDNRIQTMLMIEDLKRNADEMSALPVNAVGAEMIPYLLKVKNSAGFGAYVADTLARDVMRMSSSTGNGVFEAVKTELEHLRRAEVEIQENLELLFDHHRKQW